MSHTVYAEFNIQEAIDAAAPGEVIHIPSGRYQGNFIITKPLTLLGEEGAEFMSKNNNPALRIDNAATISISNLKLSGKSKAIVASKVDGLELSNIYIKDTFAGVHIQRSNNIHIHDIQVTGSEGHYAEKGNGIAIYKSKDILIENNCIEQMQDGVYVEEVKGIIVQHNNVTQSRYATHFMYTSDAKAFFNNYFSNVTGFMVMMTTDLFLENNTVENHSDYNGYGMLLFDVQRASIAKNIIKNNRTGLALQKSSMIQIDTNNFQMNQTAVEGTKVSNNIKANNNSFTGNILTARSDQLGFQLNSNYYDDYTGIDIEGNGYGDVPYVAMSSFGQWMVRQPVYQYFVASPSVVLLTTLDQQINKTESRVLVDHTPRLTTKQEIANSKLNVIQTIIGLILLVSSLWLWKRGITE